MATDRFDYLIVGGGMVADAAARGIREIDADGTIGILSDDIEPPYARPALSKKLWTDPDFSWDDVPLGTVEDTGATLLLETTAEKLRPPEHSVQTSTGGDVEYGELLIATGGHPVPLPIPESERVLTFRTAEDYRRLRAFADEGARVAVVGGGYIGTELAAALVTNGAGTVLIYPKDVLLGDVLPADLAAHVEGQFRDAGVELVAGSPVASGEVRRTDVLLRLKDGRDVAADAVVSGLGIEPSVGIASSGGLEVDDGIVVDEHLRTSAEGVWAAGDVALYPDRLLGRRRVEHVDNAKEMGKVAGRNLAGADEAYDHTPFYYSVLFGKRYEAVGTMDSSLETVEDWQDRFEKGVVYYLDGGEVVGVLLWGVEDATDAARAVIRDQPKDLVGRIR